MKKWFFTVLCLMLLGPQAGAGEKDKTPAAGPEAAITQMARNYQAAFNKGDAKALGAMFAEDVEYTDEDGVLISGRNAVVELLKKSFVLDPGAKMEIQVQSVRSIAPNVAIERGSTLTTSQSGEKSPSAYTAVHVYQDGQWHIKQLVESPVPDPTPAEVLSELGWLVGTWNEKDGEADINTTVNWAKGNNYLTRNFKVVVKDSVSMQGWQIIGWDASNKKIRSWLFDTEGAFQEGSWTRNGDRWTVRQTGYLPSGETITSDSILQRVNNDHCTWETTTRTLDGDPQPTLPRIDIIRVKGK